MSSHDEVHYWNDPAVAQKLRSLQTGVTEFAEEVEKRIQSNARVVELGSGAGDDAAYFAEHGHDVVAFDVSHPLIEMSAQRYADIPNLDFRVADISKPLNVSGQSVDVVYARLSLHYFEHNVTMRIFAEISWVLRPGGQFFWACKSTEDPLYGRGVELEPDMYEQEGHVRHFFSRDYATELMEDNGFVNLEVSTGSQRLYGEPSAYVKCAATKP